MSWTHLLGDVAWDSWPRQCLFLGNFAPDPGPSHLSYPREAQGQLPHLYGVRWGSVAIGQLMILWGTCCVFTSLSRITSLEHCVVAVRPVLGHLVMRKRRNLYGCPLCWMVAQDLASLTAGVKMLTIPVLHCLALTMMWLAIYTWQSDTTRFQSTTLLWRSGSVTEEEDMVCYRVFQQAQIQNKMQNTFCYGTSSWYF